MVVDSDASVKFVLDFLMVYAHLDRQISSFRLLATMGERSLHT